jgi:hypothetical protein
MKLTIRRDQADVKGMLGGHKGVTFSLWYQVGLTPTENDLVTRYRLGSHILCKNNQGVPLLTVDQAIRGNREEMPSVQLLVHNERVVREACADFKQLLEVASTFGGEEVVDIS